MEKTLAFLQKLSRNNNREWFEKHKAQYLASRGEFEELCGKILPPLRKADKALSPDMEAAKCIFRIYRDVRFSKDKTPYKEHMAASFNPGGRKSTTAGYYLHVQPGDKSFIAGGVWMPDTETLQAIRQEVDYNAPTLLKIMNSSAFKKYFRDFDEEGRLKTMPKGYDKDHPQAQILRNRHFIVSHMFTDKQVASAKFGSFALEGFKAMIPLMAFLREAQGSEDSEG